MVGINLKSNMLLNGRVTFLKTVVIEEFEILDDLKFDSLHACHQRWWAPLKVRFKRKAVKIAIKMLKVLESNVVRS